MSMESHNRYGSAATTGAGPLWMLALLWAVCLILALPGFVLGLLLSRFKGASRWSLLLWLVLAFTCAGLLFWLFQHGLQTLMIQQLTDVVLAIKHHQADITEWNLSHLWRETWPIWLRTLLVAPGVVVWQRVDAETKGTSGASLFQRQQRQRQQRITRSHHVARQRTQRPERLPDEIDGVLVMGVPLDDDPIR
jgi:hypothetical protein